MNGEATEKMIDDLIENQGIDIVQILSDELAKNINDEIMKEVMGGELERIRIDMEIQDKIKNIL